MNLLVFVNATVVLLFAVVMAVEAIIFPQTAKVFGESALLLGFVGVLVAISVWRPFTGLGRNMTFLLTSSLWISAGIAGAVPLLLWGLTPVDAVFESFSGLTTTGATVMSGLDQTPPGILMWRAMLQAFGGIGFIVTGMALLPILRTGGMQLFRTESSDKGDKELRSATTFASATVVAYVALIVICALTYHLGGMSVFDAITHAMTTLSTGGFSNYDASFGHFQSPFLQWMAALFMFLGAIPFAWYIRAAVRHAVFSEQVVALAKTLAVVIGMLTIWLVATSDRHLFDALRLVTFNVISVVTTTGYATEDYLTWGPFAVAMFFFLTAMGGCTGSTAGGAKMMRWIILTRAAAASVKSIRTPHGVHKVKYEGRNVSDDVILGVISFFMFYFLTVMLLTLALSLAGLDFATAVSGALTSVANVGPGMGDIIGPSGNFEALDSVSKMLLVFGMYAGRLEMITVFVLFTRGFWEDF
jgi:trk system potassium uptake protein TrkH